MSRDFHVSVSEDEVNSDLRRAQNDLMNEAGGDGRGLDQSFPAPNWKRGKPLTQIQNPSKPGSLRQHQRLDHQVRWVIVGTMLTLFAVLDHLCGCLQTHHRLLLKKCRQLRVGDKNLGINTHTNTLTCTGVQKVRPMACHNGELAG